MSRCGSQCEILHVEQKVYGVGQNDPVNQCAAEKQKVFDRMHGQPGPGPDIAISMVDVMSQLIKRLPVQQSVNQIEINCFPDWNEEENCHKPKRILRPGHDFNVSVRKPPDNQRFVTGPDTDTADNGPKHVVQHLVSEQEGPTLAECSAVESKPLFLSANNVKVKVKTTRNDQHQNEVPQPHQRYPAETEVSGNLKRWLKVCP